jgi:ferric-dicitrate binding protein FerR (iron transport regulator)
MTMAPTFPSVDSATLKALRKGDAGALEKIHRAAYAALLAEASHQGGDASFGPPVAELAMVTVWENRANIESAEELETAIHAAVRGGVTREQRRRAANKGEAKAAAGTVDSTWAHIAAEIAKMPAPGARKHGEVKHHVEKASTDGGRGVMIGVGVLLLIAAAIGGWWVLQSGAHGVATSSYTLPDAKSVAVTLGQRGNLPLGPGDTAAIGSDTKIVVGGDYGTKIRAVRVDGSASFRVAAGPRFEVNMKDASVFTETAANFAVRDYKDDPAIIVRVKEGEVKVEGAKEARTVGAGKAVSIAKDGTMSEPSADVVEQALSWTDGKITFTNAPLKVVMSELARWFDLPVTTKDTTLYTRPVTMSVALGSNKDAIAALEQNASVKFSYDKDSKPVLQDAPPKAAEKAAAPAKKKGK